MATATESTSAGQKAHRDTLSGAFFWLSTFYFVYCARPEDWIPGLEHIPLAKISGVFALMGLLMSLGRTQRRLRDLPPEAIYLFVMMGILFVSAVFSPVWRGGALSRTIDFSKVYVAWLLTFMLVITIARLRRIIFIQTVSVVMITAVSILKGHSRPRLEGVIGGIYSNPNDLAFAVVLSLPFALAFLIAAKGPFRKAAWACGILIMTVALFMTASRAGFITLLISGVVCLWHFGIRGKRWYLIAVTGLLGTLLLFTAGHKLKDRFWAISGEDLNSQMETSASGSYEARLFLMRRAVHGILQYPVLGIGVRNFQTYSTIWHDVHMTYLQVAVEGGIGVLVLYLMFFWRGFSNLKKLRRRNLDSEARLFVGALHSSLVGFVVGACFAPEAYQFFPYFTVAYTSSLAATLRESQAPRVAPQIPPERGAATRVYVGSARANPVSVLR